MNIEIKERAFNDNDKNYYIMKRKCNNKSDKDFFITDNIFHDGLFVKILERKLVQFPEVFKRDSFCAPFFQNIIYGKPGNFQVVAYNT